MHIAALAGVMAPDTDLLPGHTHDPVGADPAAHPVVVFADPRWRAHHDRMSELGFEIDFNDLVYHGQRSHIVDHLSQRGWQTRSKTIAELHAANGFVYADDDVAAAFADVTYSSAVLGR